MANLGTGEALAVAWSLGWRVAAGIILGYYADTYLGTVPWLTLLFSLAALVTGVRSILALLASDSSGDESEPHP